MTGKIKPIHCNSTAKRTAKHGIINEHQPKSHTKKHGEKTPRCQLPALLIKRSDRRGREEIKRFDRLSPAGTSLTRGDLCLIGRTSGEAKDGSLGVRNLSVGSAGPCIIASLSVREASVTLCNIMGSTLKVLPYFASCRLSKSRQQRS